MNDLDYGELKMKFDTVCMENDQLRAEVARLQEEVHKCQGMANEINIVTKEARRLRAALKVVEWVYSYDPNDVWVCAWCNRLQDKGHHPNCPRQLALNGEPQHEP